MSVIIKGICENGKVSLAEPAPTDEKVLVSVVFPQDEEMENIMSGKYKIRWGSLAGKISIPHNFNDELEDFKEYM